VEESKKSVLIVDDDRTILKTAQAILQLEGYSVHLAETGQEAIEKSETQFYNVALLDIKLPDMEGTDLLTKMHTTMPRMMKIMITGYPSLANAVEALNLGADAYLIKPIDPEELLMVVKEKLTEQEEVEEMSQEKVKEWIETRVRQLRADTNVKL
jgi:DNA-binding NtrC family response regulator